MTHKSLSTELKQVVVSTRGLCIYSLDLIFLLSGGNSVKYTEPNLFLMHMNMEIVYNTIQMQYTIQIHTNIYITSQSDDFNYRKKLKSLHYFFGPHVY